MTKDEFGHYSGLVEIGRGGMGCVYRAIDSRRGRTVALKLLQHGRTHDDSYRERFLLESRLAARLTNPHVIPIHDWGEIDGQLFIDMRYVEGHDVTGLIESESLSVRQTAQIVRQIASALAAAHDDGLVHRDVKPSNILVTEAGWEPGAPFAYLIDFGIAHHSEMAGRVRMTRTGQRIGSLAYMAPERLLGEVGDARSDIYSLGATLYEMLCGRIPPGPGEPFPGPPPEGLTMPPPSFVEVIRKAMATDPAARYPNVGALGEAVRAAAVAAGGAATATGPAEPRRRGEPTRSASVPNPGIATTGVGTRPVGLLLTIEGHALVISERPPSLSLVDRDTGRTRISVPLPITPSDVAISRNGGRIYVAGVHEDKILAVDTKYLTAGEGGRTEAGPRAADRTNPFLTEVNVRPGPTSVALSPDGRQIYVVSTHSDDIEIIDTSEFTAASRDAYGGYSAPQYTNNHSFATAGDGSGPVRVLVGRDGRTLYTADRQSGAVSVVQTDQDYYPAPRPHVVAVGDSVNDIALSPDGRFLYALCTEPPRLSVISTRDLTIVRSTNIDHVPTRLAVSPDARHVYVTCESSNLILSADVSGNGVRPGGSLLVESAPTALCVSHDSPYLCVLSTGCSTLSRIHLGRFRRGG